MSEITAIVGARVRTVRKSRHLTLEDLGGLSGINSNYIGQIERGQKNITAMTLEKLANALDISPVDLVRQNLPDADSSCNIPEDCRELIRTQPPDVQKQLYLLLKNIAHLEC